MRYLNARGCYNQGFKKWFISIGMVDLYWYEDGLVLGAGANWLPTNLVSVPINNDRYKYIPLGPVTHARVSKTITTGSNN